MSAEAIGSSLQIIARTGVIERLETGGGLAMIRIDSELPTLVDLLTERGYGQAQSHAQVSERIIGQRRGEAGICSSALADARIGHGSRGDEPQPSRTVQAERCRLRTALPRSSHALSQDATSRSPNSRSIWRLDKRKEAEYERLNQVVRYAQTPRCRQAAILEYFGDTAHR